MTRGEAIKILGSLYNVQRLDTLTQEEMTAVAMAIKALEQQPCEDCISRQAVLDGLVSIAKVKARSDAQKSLMGRSMFFVEQLPPVTPKEKTGKWIDSNDWKERDFDFINFRKRCSLCNGTGHIQDKFCPNCGTKMVEPQESEDKKCK